MQLDLAQNFDLGVAEFALKNNSFILLEMFNQVMDNAIGTKLAPLYASLTVGFLEETVLLPLEPPKYFPHENSKLIEKLFKKIYG